LRKERAQLRKDRPLAKDDCSAQSAPDGARCDPSWSCSTLFSRSRALSCAAPAPQTRDATIRLRALAPCRTPATPMLCGKYVVFEKSHCSGGPAYHAQHRPVLSPRLGPKPVPDPVFVLVGRPWIGRPPAWWTGASEWVTARARHERDISSSSDPTAEPGALIGSRARFSGRKLRSRTPSGICFPIEERTRVAARRLRRLPMCVSTPRRSQMGRSRRRPRSTRICSDQSVRKFLRGAGRAPVSSATFEACFGPSLLAGVATPAAKQPLQFAKGAHDAMGRLIADCTADEGVPQRLFPDLKAEFDRPFLPR